MTRNRYQNCLKTLQNAITTDQQYREELKHNTDANNRNYEDLIRLHQQQQSQIATLVSQNNFQLGHALHPTPFHGKQTDDLNAFLSHFERYSEFCGWDSKQRLKALPLYLQGNAGSWYTSCPDQFSTYESLVDALKNQFSNPASLWLWRQQLCSRTQGETETVANYASDIRRLCKRIGLQDIDRTQYFIQGLRPDLKTHVILGQPKTLAEAENLANLKETVSIATPNHTQQKLEMQLQTLIRSVEALKTTPASQPPHVAAYNSNQNTKQNPYSYDHEGYSSQHHRHPPANSDEISKLVREEVRRQTRFLLPNNGPANSGIPSNRNRRTTDGLPICNNCDKVGHIARNCRSHPRQPTHNQTPPTHNQAPTQNQTPQTGQPLRPNAEIFSTRRTNNPFDQHSGN